MFYSIVDSGKTGNCVIINDVMVDCGVAFSKIKPYLDGIRYLLLTHIHQDHVNRLTLETIKLTRPDITIIGNTSVHRQFGVDEVASDYFCIPTEHYTFTAFALTHDVQNTGYTWRYEGKDIIFAIDTGDLAQAPDAKFDYFFLESNYDADALTELNEWTHRNDRLPFVQFAGRHLSRQDAAAFVMLNRKNDQAELIELHKSDLLYDRNGALFR